MISDERLKELEPEDDLYNYPPTQEELNSMAKELLALRKVREGWKLVPVEPTEGMNKAGWNAMNEHDAINPTYRAMLAAAPKPE